MTRIPFHLPAPQPATIMVVDDQQANIETVGVLLTTMGYNVMAATSAALALERIQAHKPDLILLDMMMPGVSGLDLCRKLQSDQAFAGIPVIFLSAADEVNLIAAALESGAVDYVTKPFHRAELLSRVRTHLALKTTREELQQAMEDKDELLRLMAHDFKNRLAALQIHADFLQGETGISPQGAESARTLSREARRASDCIRELLANHSAAQPHALKMEQMDAEPILRQACASLQPVLASKGQRLLLPKEPQPLPVMADAAALRQIVENLVSNASKFSPAGSTVKLTWQRRVAMAEITVQDEGPGFTAEDRERVFHRYGRLSAQPTGGETSSGLGLNIVYLLARNMGGFVEVAPEPGPGAIVRVWLP